jgi:predicted nuclease of predicted toxin-antitoxin system
MKLLLDQGLARSTVQHLAVAGIQAEHVGDLGLANAEDRVILAEARTRQAIVLTLDADFHRLLALGHESHPSVIRIRIEGLKGREMADVILQVLSNVEEDLMAGAVVSVTPTRIRVRRLPIG